MPRPFHVAKFGGSSVATPERLQQVVELIALPGADKRRVVVVSALGGVTDQLLHATEAALARTRAYIDVLARLRHRHADALAALARPEEHEALQAHLDAHLHTLRELLDGVYLLRECTPRSRDAIVGTGERLSAPILAAALRASGQPAHALDATELIVTDATFGEAQVDFAATRTQVRQRLAGVAEDAVAVVTGFIAATPLGVLTTLGRSGSDYTATILAGALDAEAVTIWTDVDGVLSADPRLVPEAFSLAELSYREAAELAYFGAKVLHPRTMRPLIEQQIPLVIKNTLNPKAAGTRVTVQGGEVTGEVRAVTAVRNVAVVMLEGTGMMGVPGMAARTFQALAEQGINVLVISQASSEQSICLAVRATEAEAAVAALERAFAAERAQRHIARIYAIRDCAVVSAVGEGMRHQPGLAGRMFAALGRCGVNVLAIAQGAAETNISAVIAEAELQAALDVIHDTFALRHQRAHVFLLGTGGVAQALLQILSREAPRLLGERGWHLKLVGAANTRHACWEPAGLPFSGVASRLAASEEEPAGALANFRESKRERRILLDMTASDDVAATYPDWLAAGVHLVTPNKRANTKAQAFYEKLRATATAHRVQYRYETTVGAGLPVLTTLRDLRETGDRIHRIEGVVSGTLAFVCNALAAGQVFSEAVREARQRGFTEPDPREDLGGEDVARKLLILAREAGLTVERAEVQVESLIPEALIGLPVADFLARLPEADAAWAARVAEAAAAGQRLQYLGRIADGRLTVSLQAVGPDSPFHALRGTDNLIAFTTDRYQPTPLVLRGPGAGPQVTAAGVLADLLAVLRET